VRPVEERTLWLGVDIGKVVDPAALSLLERVRTFVPGPFQAGFQVHGSWSTSYGIRHLERLKLGTPYPLVAERVGAVCESLAASSPVSGPLMEVVVDVTGVGRPVFDMLVAIISAKRLRVRVVGVNYTGGNLPSMAADGSSIWNLPKRDLVACLVLLFQSRELRIAERLPEAQVLVNELVNFQQTISDAGRDSYGNDPKRAKNDDYVNASALAAWRARIREPRELGERQRLL